MNRRQVSWLIVRAFGLYLLVEAFMVVPDLLGGLYAARVRAGSGEREWLSGQQPTGSDDPTGIGLFAEPSKGKLWFNLGLAESIAAPTIE